MKAAPGREVLDLIDAETEAFVLGTILQTGESAFRQVAFLELEDFGVETHRIVFRAIKALADEVHIGVDVVADHLIQAGKLESVGGLAWLSGSPTPRVSPGCGSLVSGKAFAASRSTVAPTGCIPS